MKSKIKKTAVFMLCALYLMTLTVYAESYGDSSYAEVTVSPERVNGKISPYIYGVNDTDELYGLSASVIKQTGSGLSSYNWETNFSNSLKNGISSNGIDLIDDMTDKETPALYTDKLMRHAASYEIPVKLATLQLMGYVANDAKGDITDDDNEDRWVKTSFSKMDSYLNVPNKTDNIVYIDEYAAYLVNKYGTVEEGGFNGFLLDSEPDLWNTNYPSLDLGEADADEIIERSVKLSSSLKIIDNSALVFGPSVSGVSSCADLDGSFTREGSFIDYYLYEMRKNSIREKTRLLDVLDVHYIAENGNSVNGNYLTAAAFRMQSVRALWDGEYSDNTSVYNSYGKNMPLIKTLNESIDTYYPNTKLSFSEYSFGGGDDMSGCIAEVDALGAFAENGVYLACLLPDEVWEYQKSAINLFRNYDYKGGSVGNISVLSSTEELTASCHAMTDEKRPEKLWIILTNKNLSRDKLYDINISSPRSYSAVEMYTVSGNNSHIEKETANIPEISDNTGSITLPAKSVCLLVLETEDAPVTDMTAATDESTVSDMTYETTGSVPAFHEEDAVKNTIEIITESVGTSPDEDEIVPGFDEPFEEITVMTGTSAVPYGNEEDLSDGPDDSRPDTYGYDDREFPLPLKITVTIIVAGCAAAIFYILIIDK